MVIGITGMNGFLGSAVATTSQQQGHKVVRIVLPRTREIRDEKYIRQFLAPLKVDAIIHTAVTRYPNTESEEYLNASFPAHLEKTFRLINEAGIFIHISSANVLVRSLQDRYTKTKRSAELHLTDSQAIIIRPSLIWSWDGQGDAKRLEKYVGRLFSLMVYPGNIHLPVLIQDIAEKIVALIKAKNKNKIFNIIGDTRCSIWELAKCFSNKHNGFLIPIPTLPDVGFLPKPLRTIDYTIFDYSMFQKPSKVITLPFRFW